MPLVDVTMVEGRPYEKVRRMVSEVTDAVERCLEAPRRSIRVVVREVPATHWAAGDITVAEREG